MSKLLDIRQKLNLTQEDLFERSGISVRTIQRLEAGTIPKGYTLKALAKALSVPEEQLVDQGKVVVAEDVTSLKWINISALPFVICPPLNVIAPLLLMFAMKHFTPLTKKILTIQIVWSLLAGVLIMMVMILNDVFAIRGQYMILLPVVWLLVNAFIILRNAAAIDKSKSLSIDLKFSLI
jgi:transcriptional regulator with XRE-family HTH domain